MPIVRQMELIS